eukprot:GILK01011754.1.p1 GENE.GILK01011754.1~~GILK01011754.1.p1  ORF type:complete len:720 (+),score=171.68 GILK01011754.1:34-2193(+)
MPLTSPPSFLPKDHSARKENRDKPRDSKENKDPGSRKPFLRKGSRNSLSGRMQRDSPMAASRGTEESSPSPFAGNTDRTDRTTSSTTRTSTTDRAVDRDRGTPMHPLRLKLEQPLPMEMKQQQDDESDVEDDPLEMESVTSFGDDQAWGDIDEKPFTFTGAGGSYGAKRAAEESKMTQQSDHFDEPPPTSALVKKLFYKDTHTFAAAKAELRSDPKTDSAEITDLKAVLKEKLQVLESEIARFTTENERCKQLRMEREKALQTLQSEKEEFRKQQEEEMKRFEEWKEGEMKRIKRDRRIAERQARNGNSNGGRPEREEMDALKEQIHKLQEDAKAREARFKAAQDRLKQKIDELTAKNEELEEELRFAEHNRLNSWDLAETSVTSKKKTVGGGGTSKAKKPLLVKSKSETVSMHSSIASMDSNVESGLRTTGDDKPINNSNFNSNINSNINSAINENVNVNAKKSKLVVNSEPPAGTEPLFVKSKKETSSIQSSLASMDEHFGSGLGSKGIKINILNEMVNSKKLNVVDNEPLGPAVTKEHRTVDGKTERFFEDGSKEILFANGVRKETHPDGYSVVYFTNGDVKETFPDKRVVYFYAEAETTQTTYADGMQLYEFANQQTEKHFPDGTKEISFPDGTLKCIFSNGEEESIFPNGTVQRIDVNGVKIIEFSTGQKDVTYPDGLKIREYPDGTIKRILPDGTTETVVPEETSHRLYLAHI